MPCVKAEPGWGRGRAASSSCMLAVSNSGSLGQRDKKWWWDFQPRKRLLDPGTSGLLGASAEPLAWESPAH